MFSQWSFATGPMIKREDYTFEKLLNRESIQKDGRQLELPIDDEDEEGVLIREYPPIHYRRLKEYE